MCILYFWDPHSFTQYAETKTRNSSEINNKLTEKIN